MALAFAVADLALPEDITVASTVGDGATHVFVGMKGDLEAAASAFPTTLGAAGAALSRTSPGRDAPSTAETTVEAGRVIVIALPTDCSRHNTAARSHAVRSGLVGLAKSGADYPMNVVACIPTLDRALASVNAVGSAFPKYSHKSGVSGDSRAITVAVHCPEGAPSEDMVADLQATVTSTRLTAALVDMPCMELHTDRFVDIAQSVVDEVGATMKVIRGTELRDGGFGGLWGVGQAAVHLPALAILSYVPEGVEAGAESVCMVGKGIVYDTGGLSIKTKTGMPGMKRDMGGAAGILGAFRTTVLAAKNGLGADATSGKPIHALLCLAENAVSKEATRPDDVLEMYSGKTVEVNNTDAEGRLVLGDGVAYAVKHLNPSHIFDMATLTGAQGVSTGANHGALYCNNDELEETLVATGKESGDLTFPLPFAPEFYRKEFRSAVADMKNSVANRANAQSSCAGQFIGNHLGDFLYSGKWGHIDMAYPSHVGERGTGYGVALLSRVVRRLK